MGEGDRPYTNESEWYDPMSGMVKLKSLFL